MKVLLLSANRVTTPYPVYPLGLDYVAAALTPNHQVQIADMNILGQAGALAESVNRFAPDIIGLSLRNIDNTDTTDPHGFIPDYREVVEAIRGCTPVPIVLGGAGFSLFPRKIMAALKADFGIIGEGERLADLLDALAQGDPAPDLPGVITAHGPENFPLPLAGNFQRQFHPDFQVLDFYLQKGGMLNLQTKRGCPFRCIYCTYPYIEGRRFRLIDPQQVAQTALALQHAGAKYIFITDSAFNADIDHSLAVAREFMRLGLATPWGAFLAPIGLPPRYFRTLAQAGLTHVEFGTESLSNRVLRAYGKPYDRPQVLAAHQAAVDAGLHAAHYFLLGGPGETAETLETTLANVAKLKKAVLFLFCGMRIYPHTALYDHALSEGQIDPSQDLLAPVYYQSPAIHSDDIISRVKAESRERINWVIGGGGDETGRVLTRLHDRGYTGPLWEYLIR
jgi:radical SAM superfamily enzyme YgiQ (UPF0313 family)